ncbi:MAG: lipopolysaccharide kinase InaA family protein [Arenicella sp.]
MSTWFNVFGENVSREFSEVLMQPEDLIRSGHVLKDDKSTTVVSFSWKGQRYILKRFNARSFGHAIKRALRKTRASVCWDMSREFARAGIHVATPIAMLERRLGVFRMDAYFVSEHVEGEELLQWLPQQAKPMVEQVTLQIQELFSILLDKHLSHGDMKATNLLWSDHRVVVIDLDAAKSHRFPVFFQRSHKRDRRRFMRNGELFSKMLADSPHGKQTDSV